MLLWERKKHYDKPLDKALDYYKILFLLAGKKLANRELDVIAYTAVKGAISTGPARKEFVELFQSSEDTLNNLLTSLKKKKIIVDEDGIKRLNKNLRRNFTEDWKLTIELYGPKN